MNAVVDALDRAYGIRDIDMPATPRAGLRGDPGGAPASGRLSGFSCSGT